MISYDEALQIIAGMAHHKWRQGLDRMEAFVERAGLTSALSGPRYLHVAGTNGKGSVTATLHHVLAAHGVACGAYFSPYVFDFRERIQADLALIPRDDLARWVDRLLPVAASFVGTEFGEISEFEFKTALALAFWAERGCEWVALEVGLGGRIDATNVVRPAACGIVSIGYDHTAILGETLTLIAAEKAGIAKPGVPLVLGNLPEEAAASALRVAREVGAPVWRFGQEVMLETEAAGWTVTTPVATHSGLVPGLKGTVQPHNMAVAVGMLDAAAFPLNEDALREGVATTRLPGRFQKVRVDDRDVILDGAHNRESAEVLAASLRREAHAERTVLVLGMVKGHDATRFVEPLRGFFDAVALAPIDFYRAYEVGELAEAAGLSGAFLAATDAEALAWALDDAGPGGRVVVTGSFYLVGSLGRSLGLGD